MRKSFRDLRVWHMAMDLSVLVYSLTENFPQREVYGLSSQMRRAAVSIASNIAEGSARTTRKDFRQFVLTAKGSACELQTQIMLAGRLEYGSDAQRKDAEALCNDIARMLSGLAAFLKQKPQTKPEANQQHVERTTRKVPFAERSHAQNYAGSR